ncbi:MAG: VWA domain-containing protein [Gammaproteobacteria bacterium]
MRRNVRHGMDMLELSRVKRRTRKTRLVLLSDVSGSMDAFNPFLLQLMLGLQQALKNSRTLVFSTQLSEITTILRRSSVRQTLDEIGTTVKHWSGGTDIGAALAELNRGVLREGSSRATVAIIISDGYDNGSSERIEREMQAMRRRVRKVVWINPMFGATTFQVRAAGMKAALPYVDHFLPAFNAASLKILVRELARI